MRNFGVRKGDSEKALEAFFHDIGRLCATLYREGVIPSEVLPIPVPRKREKVADRAARSRKRRTKS